MKGVPHYLKDGTLHEGGSHKMPNGEVHTGKTHSKDSQKLFHFDDLSKQAKKKASASKNKKDNAKDKSFTEAVESRIKKGY
tara:strand:- start:2510 stop:2752 length:243 start_codon:yes stop_codon:yes gene_type:complete